MADFNSIEAQLNAEAAELQALKQRVDDVADGRTRSTELLRIELQAYAKALQQGHRKESAKTVTALLAAANALKQETKKGREEARTQMNAAVRGMSDLIRQQHGQTRQVIRDEHNATRGHIDGWGQRLLQAIGGGDNPVVAILVTILGALLGVFTGIRAWKILSALETTRNLWSDEGVPLMKDGQEVIVNELVFAPTQAKLIAILLAVSAFLVVIGVYFLICHIVRAFRTRTAQ